MPKIMAIELSSSQIRGAVLDITKTNDWIEKRTTPLSPLLLIKGDQWNLDTYKQGQVLIQAIVAFIKEKLFEGIGTPVDGVGIAVRARIKRGTGEMIPTHSFQSAGFPFRSPLEQELRIRNILSKEGQVVAGNRSNLGAWAERQLGAGVSVDTDAPNHFAYLTVERYIGVGLIINGQIYTGSKGLAGEFGHMIIDRGNTGEPCPACNQRGCASVLASGMALVREILPYLKNGGAAVAESIILERAYDPAIDVGYTEPVEEVGTILGYIDALAVIQAGDIAQHAIPDLDSKSIEVLQRVGRRLGWTLEQIVRSFNPQMVVLGGIAATGKVLQQTAYDEMAQHIHREMLNGMTMNTAWFGDQSALYGAVLKALEVTMNGDDRLTW